MKEVINWIARLRRIEATSKAAEQGECEPPGIQEFYLPLLARGFRPLSHSDSFFAIQPLMPLTQRSGDPAPIAQSLLRVMDSPDLSAFAHHALADELAALACAALGGWVDVVKAIPIKVEGSSTTSFMNAASMADASLNRPIGDYSCDPLNVWVELVASLGPPDDETIGAAIRLHHGAVLLYEHDLRAAYVLVVAGIEVLSRQYGSPPNEWSMWEDGNAWDKLLTELQVSAVQSAAIRSQLLADKHLRLKQTFRAYASESLPDTFWDTKYSIWNYGHHAPSGTFLPAELFSETPIGEMLSRDRALLSSSLGKSYDLRSGLVHRGEKLGFMDAAVAPWKSIDGSNLVPFGLLRLILLELITNELRRRSRSVAMPMMKLQVPEM